VGARAERRPPGAKVLSVQNLSMQNQVRNTSFSIFAGQVTGVFGLVGSGRTETARIIAGAVKRDAFHGGDIRLGDRSVRYRTPRAAVGDGVVYVTEDRKGDGLFETMSVADNIYVGQIARDESRGVFASRSEKLKLATQWTKKLNIRTLGGDPRVIELSGGNQQKVVIAKSLVQNPKLIIFDEPTRGVDVGAKRDLYELLVQLAADGVAVLLVSNEMEEILGLAHRVLVMRAGRIVTELRAEQMTESAVLAAAFEAAPRSAA
jgi:simple sugar transport system ATP-binding protein